MFRLQILFHWHNIDSRECIPKRFITKCKFTCSILLEQPAGATFTLFQVTVINIPVQNPIINAFASYLYTVNPALPATSKQQTPATAIRNANLSVIKFVDKTFAEVGDTLTYTFSLSNSGNVAANNKMFRLQILFLLVQY